MRFSDHIWLILALACLGPSSKFIYLVLIYFFLLSLASSQHCLVGLYFYFYLGGGEVGFPNVSWCSPNISCSPKKI
jgi:hypothetical protein